MKTYFKRYSKYYVMHFFRSLFKFVIVSLVFYQSLWAKNLQVINGKINGKSQQVLKIPRFSSDYVIIDVELENIDLAQQGLSLGLCQYEANDHIGNNPTNCKPLAKDITRKLNKHFLDDPKQQYALQLVLPPSQQNIVHYKININNVPTQNPIEKPNVNLEPSSALLQDVLIKIQSANANNKKQIINRFWQHVKEQGTPLIEPIDKNLVKMTFLWRGAKRNVRLVGGPSNDHTWLSKLPETDIWFYSFDLPKNTKLSYEFSVDIPTLAFKANETNQKRKQRLALLASLTTDPFNKNTFPSVINKHYPFTEIKSSIELEDGRPINNNNVINKKQPLTGNTKVYLKPYKSNNKMLERRVWFYKSKHLNKHAKPIVLYFFDGKRYLHTVDVPKLLDELIEKELIPPLNAVFIDNPSLDARREQLPSNPEFAKFMAHDVVPWVTNNLGIQGNTENVLIGSSYGGLAASYIAGHYPEIFAKVISLSGSFWWHPQGLEKNSMAQFYADTPRKPIRFYLSAGKFETSRAGELSILETNQQLYKVLKNKHYSVKYSEYDGGHDYLMWKYALRDGLQYLF